MGTNHSSRTILHPHNPAFNPDSRQCANLPVEVTTQGSLFNRLLKRYSTEGPTTVPFSMCSSSSKTCLCCDHVKCVHAYEDFKLCCKLCLLYFLSYICCCSPCCCLCLSPCIVACDACDDYLQACMHC
ncbi:uncharacterized protein LOC129972235 isoform X2 [Argiope bruennichi]|uniref:uncharacterized protein LOC129972235 isoform X2 n=1 Tax=Argiope bruennichi TaxID=94029 RepID=UPI00249513D3|nr:uncharacterized protein LOC129972235 isoform X2 [Argiope bruennichi]XP_055942261.1 uncharacterized protein LOC129972235 isoform X2 [Argiope bruennichi]